MASENQYHTPNLTERLNYLRTCSAEDIIKLTIAIHDLHSQLPHEYLTRLTKDERIICLRASLVCWSVTEGKQVPREMQMRAILADQLGRDSLISAGTGSGKTLPIALNILLDDPAKNIITLTISPLKRLQRSQEEDFTRRYGIRTFAINKDTPRDEAWWTSNIFSTQKKISLPVQHLIVTVEQLFKSPAGHEPRIAELLRTPAFQKLVARINIDEAHCFYTAGFSLYGLPAFRPAWERLAELKIVLRPLLPWHLFSATFPPHILTHVKARLLKPKFDYIHQTSNRPNIMYATHQVPGKLDDPRNYECFLCTPYNPSLQPNILIFVDNKSLTSKITTHLDSNLPAEYRGTGVVKHYHSSMSKLYLEETHADFISPTGTCKILVTTSGQSVGIDFPNVKIVATLGLPTNIVDALQRGGRGIRTGNEHALFIVFYEPWALEIDEDEYMEGADPDRPRANLGTNARAQERAPLSAVQLVRCRTCLRMFYANYLNEQTASATLYTAPFCCDRHDDGFSLQDFLPGKLFQNEETSVEKPKQARSSASKVRPRAERLLLEDKIVDWLTIQVQKDPDRRPSDQILSFEQTKILLRMPSTTVTSSAAIVDALNENEEWTDEWAAPIYQLIVEFDIDLQSTKAIQAAEKKTASKAKRVFINQTQEDFIEGSSSNKRKRTL